MCSSHSAQRFGGIGTRGNPRGRGSKHDARDQRECERETKHGQRWPGINRDEMRSTKGKQQDRPRSGKGHKQRGQASNDCEQNAFRENRADEPAPLSAQGNANRGHRGGGRSPGQQEGGNVGASDQ